MIKEKREKERFYVDTSPECREESMIQGERFRISVLTEGLLRLEYSESGRFVDGPTQVVWNREFPGIGIKR